MKIAVIGGTGLIGSQVVKNLDAAGHEAVPHSLSTGVDLLSGEGVVEAVAGADVVVNLTNSPTFDEASPSFFQTSMDNLVTASEKGGVGHMVILSIVGVDQVPELDYYRAKTLQEDILKAGSIPYSIVRATQFMEFMEATMSWTTDGDTVRLPQTPLQPIAAADVARMVAEVASGPRSTGPWTSPVPTSSPWRRSAGSPSRPRGTDARSSSTTPRACSPSPGATSSPAAATPASPPPTTGTGCPDDRGVPDADDADRGRSSG